MKICSASDHDVAQYISVNGVALSGCASHGSRSPVLSNTLWTTHFLFLAFLFWREVLRGLRDSAFMFSEPLFVEVHDMCERILSDHSEITVHLRRPQPA